MVLRSECLELLKDSRPASHGMQYSESNLRPSESLPPLSHPELALLNPCQRRLQLGNNFILQR